MLRTAAAFLVPFVALLCLLFLVPVKWWRTPLASIYRLLFAAAWIAFAGGLVLIGLWLLGFARNLNYETVSVVTATAFAVLTLPLAWHEMRRRTAAKVAPRAPDPAAAPRRT